MQRRVLIGVGVVLALLLFAAFLRMTSTPQQGTQTGTTQATTVQTGTQTTIISGQGSGCPTILPGPNTKSNLTQIEGTAKQVNLLDPRGILGSGETPVSYGWSQVQGTSSELDYVTSFAASILNATQRVAAVVPSAPGNYRFALTARYQNGTSREFRIDLLATEKDVRKLDLKGVIFGDVFADLGGPHFTMTPLPAPCEKQRLEDAMAGPARVGAGWVGLVPAIFYSQVSPSPLLQGLNNDLSLTNDTYYTELIASAKSHGFKVVQIDQGSVGPNTPPDQAQLLPKMQNNSAWWDEWFTQWENVTIHQAERAQKAGVDMFVLCLFCEDSFRPSVYPQYVDRWNHIISEVRRVFMGKIGMSLIVVDSRFTMYDKLDSVLVTVFPGLYISGGSFKDSKNPTMAELANATDFALSFTKALAGKITVYYVFLAYSSDGQYNADPPPWGNNPPPSNLTDFREQAMYYEAFFKGVENATWISGVFSERWDYFDHFARIGDAQNSYYFDATLGNSPRNKPAEAVIRLWFSLY